MAAKSRWALVGVAQPGARSLPAWQPVMSQLHTRESGGWKGAKGGAKVPSLSRSLAVANLRHVAVAVADVDCFCGHEGRHDGHVIKSS